MPDAPESSFPEQPDSVIESEDVYKSDASTESDGSSQSSEGASTEPATGPAFAGATDDDFERAHAALLEITDLGSIGDRAGSVDEGDGVVTVYFDVASAGYRGWRWTASIAHVEGLEPSVLETEMTPGDEAVLAPDWVPWVDRLADYRAAQDADAVASAPDADDDDESDDGESDEEDESDDDESEDDDDLDDESDEDDDDSDDEDDEGAGVGSLLHAGDLDGVDIDDLDDSGVDDDPDADEAESPVDVDPDRSVDGDEQSAPMAADGVDEGGDPEQEPGAAGDEPLGAPPVDERTGDQ